MVQSTTNKVSRSLFSGCGFFATESLKGDLISIGSYVDVKIVITVRYRIPLSLHLNYPVVYFREGAISETFQRCDATCDFSSPVGTSHPDNHAKYPE